LTPSGGRRLGYDLDVEGEDKIRENRIRRMAHRQGLTIHKSRRRDPGAVDYDKYWVFEASSDVLVAGGEAGLNLDGVEDWLTTD
jgi:hypothetical protein